MTDNYFEISFQQRCCLFCSSQRALTQIQLKFKHDRSNPWNTFGNFTNIWTTFVLVQESCPFAKNCMNVDFCAQQWYKKDYVL